MTARRSWLGVGKLGLVRKTAWIAVVEERLVQQPGQCGLAHARLAKADGQALAGGDDVADLLHSSVVDGGRKEESRVGRGRKWLFFQMEMVKIGQSHTYGTIVVSFNSV